MKKFVKCIEPADDSVKIRKGGIYEVVGEDLDYFFLAGVKNELGSLAGWYKWRFVASNGCPCEVKTCIAHRR